jgi:ATP-binding cassette subfamily B protein
MRRKRSTGRAGAFRVVLGFTFAHWRRQGRLVCGIAAAVVASTAADVLLPVYAGRLVDAVTLGASDREAALSAALAAFTVILALGAGMLALRHLAFLGIIRLTLAIMTDVARDAFHRVQRFSTEWHANAFAGSTVRKIARGMWALDLLDDTILVALLPSVVVLAGSALVLSTGR